METGYEVLLRRKYLGVLTCAVLRLPDGRLDVAEERDLCHVEEEARLGRIAEGEVGDDVADADGSVVQLHAANVAQPHLARVLVLQHVPVAQKLRTEGVAIERGCVTIILTSCENLGHDRKTFGRKPKENFLRGYFGWKPKLTECRKSSFRSNDGHFGHTKQHF